MNASMNNNAKWYVVAGLCIVAGIFLLIFVAPGNPPTALAVAPNKVVAATQAQKAAMLANEALLLNPIFSHVFMPVILR